MIVHAVQCRFVACGSNDVARPILQGAPPCYTYISFDKCLIHNHQLMLWCTLYRIALAHYQTVTMHVVSLYVVCSLAQYYGLTSHTLSSSCSF